MSGARLAVALVLAGMLAACAGGLRSSAPPVESYVLTAAPAAAPTAAQGAPSPTASTAASLRVLEPSAAPGFDSDRILILEPDGRLDPYAASRWAAALPALVEQLAVETLRNRGVWRTVEDSRGAFPSEYVLAIRIRRFDAEYGTERATGSAAPLIHVAFDCEIGRSSARELIASFSVERSVEADRNRLGAVVAAFEHAAEDALSEVAARSAAAVNSRQDPSPR